MTLLLRLKFRVTRNLNRLGFIQIPSKRLKKDTGTQVNNNTFIFIADKAFGTPVACRSWGGFWI